MPTAPGLGFSIRRSALLRRGTHFFRATKLRVAVSAVLERGLKTAKQLGAVREARLHARSRAVDELKARGVEAWQASREPPRR